MSLNPSYSTDHPSTRSLSPFPEILRAKDLRALKFRPVEGTMKMVYTSESYPGIRFIRFCDDIEDPSDVEVYDNLFVMFDENQDTGELSALEP